MTDQPKCGYPGCGLPHAVAIHMRAGDGTPIRKDGHVFVEPDGCEVGRKNCAPWCCTHQVPLQCPAVEQSVSEPTMEDRMRCYLLQYVGQRVLDDMDRWIAADIAGEMREKEQS
jgi:hypothetical protein